MVRNGGSGGGIGKELKGKRERQAQAPFILNSMGGHNIKKGHWEKANGGA